MGRSDYTKNAKKKWGLKMEELATMVERAQLEKIEFNKKSKRSGKLSKKEYAAAEKEYYAADGGAAPTMTTSMTSTTTTTTTTTRRPLVNDSTSVERCEAKSYKNWRNAEADRGQEEGKVEEKHRRRRSYSDETYATARHSPLLHKKGKGKDRDRDRDSDKGKCKGKGKGKGKGNGKSKGIGKGRSGKLGVISSSCPSPSTQMGFFSSNRGRSISFTGGPNFSYSQFNYTYGYKDNSGQAQCSAATTTTTTTIITTTTASHLPLHGAPIYGDTRERLPDLHPYVASTNATATTYSNEAEDSGDEGNHASDDSESLSTHEDDFLLDFELRDDYRQGTRLKFDDEEGDAEVEADPDLEAEAYDQLGTDEDEDESEDEDEDEGEGESEDESGHSEEDGSEEESTQSQISSAEDSEDDDEDSFTPLANFTFSHPDDDLPTSVFSRAYAKAPRDSDDTDGDGDGDEDKSGELESTYSRRKRRQRLDRERELQSSLQSILPNSTPAKFTSRGAGDFDSRREHPYSTPQHQHSTSQHQHSVPQHQYSTPQQQGRQRGREREGPHSWPKKSHMSGAIKQKNKEEELRKGDSFDFRRAHKPRDKKKVQLKSKYVKYYTSAFGTTTAARGWIEGGTVKDDDLLHKFADISERIEVQSIEDVYSSVHLAPLPTIVTSVTLQGQQRDEAVQYNDYFHEPASKSGRATNTFSPNNYTNDNHNRNNNVMRHHDDPVHHPKQTDCKSSTKRGNTAVAADATDQGPLEITVMTPKERKIYEAILAGNFRALDAGKSKKEKRKPKEKSARYPSFDVLELARLVEDCNDFVQNSNKSMSLYPMTKQQRIQVYSLATLYNFKKESVGKGGNRSPVLLKSKKSTIPHYRVLAQFIRDSVESPTSLKALYLDLDQHGAPPPSASMAMGMGMAMAASRERERETQQYGLESAGRERARARFVGENANPVGMDNVGNRMLRGMGWTGGGLGARGEGITEPISQKMKFSRSGLG